GHRVRRPDRRDRDAEERLRLLGQAPAAAHRAERGGAQGRSAADPLTPPKPLGGYTLARMPGLKSSARGLLLAVCLVLVAPASALADCGTDVINDYLKDGTINGTYS